MTRSRAISAGFNWMAFALAIAVAFFLTPHLIRSLGTARYDVWCVVEAILAYFTLLDLGIGVSLVRIVARCRGKTSDTNRVASASLVIFSLAGVVAIAIGIPLSFIVGARVGVRLGDVNEATTFMLLMLVNLAITLPLSVFGSILEGLEQFIAKSIVRVVAILTKAMIYLALTYETGTLVPLAITSIALTVVEYVVLAWLCYRSIPSLRLSLSLVDRATVHEVRGASWHAFLVMLAGRITLQTGAILIGLLLPTGLVTVFATASRIVDYLKTLLRTITVTLTPGVAAMDAAGDHQGIRQLILKSNRIVLLLAMPINVGLWFYGHVFLVRWVGTEIADQAYGPLVLISMTLSLGVAQSVASRVLYGLGELKSFARLAILETVLNLTLTLILIKPLGVVGVAIGVMIPNLIFCVGTMTVMMRRVKMPARDYLMSCVMPIASTLIPTLVWFAVGPADVNWPSIFGHGMSGLIVEAVVIIVILAANRRTARRVNANEDAAPFARRLHRSSASADSLR